MSGRNVVYLLQSERHPRQHYVGLTQNLRCRLAAHNAGRSTHTAKYRPWRIVIAVWFGDAASARRFERYLKSGSGRAFANRHFHSGGLRCVT
ncbi:MAG: GIY-YIG nuclease family protein [Acidobacteria bacterium]|nr:GIY-YIG nuclease family protein [Acidobacteriota bacterium]